MILMPQKKTFLPKARSRTAAHSITVALYQKIAQPHETMDAAGVEGTSFVHSLAVVLFHKLLELFETRGQIWLT